MELFQIYIIFTVFLIKLLFFWCFLTILYHCIKLLISFKVLNESLLKFYYVLHLAMITLFIFYLLYMQTPFVLLNYFLFEIFSIFSVFFLLCGIDGVEKDKLFQELERAFLTSTFCFIFLYTFSDWLVLFYSSKEFFNLLTYFMSFYIVITFDLSTAIWKDLQDDETKSFFD